MTLKNLFSKIFNHEKWKEERDSAITLAINHNQNKIFDCTQDVQRYGIKRGKNPAINYNVPGKYNCEKNRRNRATPVKRELYGLFSGAVYDYNIKKNIGNTKDENGNPTNLWSNTKDLPSLLLDSTESPSQYSPKNLSALQIYPTAPSPVHEVTPQRYNSKQLSSPEPSVPHKTRKEKNPHIGISLYNAACGFFRKLKSIVPRRKEPGIEEVLQECNQGAPLPHAVRGERKVVHYDPSGNMRIRDEPDANQEFLDKLKEAVKNQRKKV